MSRVIRPVVLTLGLVLAVHCAHTPPQAVDNLPPLQTDPFTGLDALGQDEEQPFTFRQGPKPPPDVSERV